MNIDLRLLGDLRDYLPAGGDYDHVVLELAEGGSVQDVLKQVQLPASVPFFLMVNQAMVQADDFAEIRLQAGDEVALFSPIKGG